MAKEGLTSNKKAVVSKYLKRESEGSTSMEKEIVYSSCAGCLD